MYEKKDSVCTVCSLQSAVCVVCVLERPPAGAVFVFLWGRDASVAGGTERDTGFQFLLDKLISAETSRSQKPTFCAYRCVRLQLMNSNGGYVGSFTNDDGDAKDDAL